MPHHSVLINSGSEGCIFVPELPCKKKTKKNKHKNNKTKLVFSGLKTNDSEYEINKLYAITASGTATIRVFALRRWFNEQYKFW